MAQKSVKDIQVTPFADLFKDDKQRQIESGERIVQLDIKDIHEFEGHPFQDGNVTQRHQLKVA